MCCRRMRGTPCVISHDAMEKTDEEMSLATSCNAVTHSSPKEIGSTMVYWSHEELEGEVGNAQCSVTVNVAQGQGTIVPAREPEEMIHM